MAAQLPKVIIDRQTFEIASLIAASSGSFTGLMTDHAEAILQRLHQNDFVVVDLASKATYDRIAQAVGDPGSVTKRILDGREPVTRWSTRAVLLSLGEPEAKETTNG